MIELKEFIEKMRATSSSLEKVEIIKNSSDFIHQILEATYNPYKQYNVTSKTCIKNKDIVTPYFGKTIFDLLDDLTNRHMTGHAAIGAINYYMKRLPQQEYKDLVFSIIDKDLKIRTGAKVINKAFPGLIPEFNVALAQEYKGKCDWTDNWYASRKLDGVRCLAVVNEEGKCTLYSRMGKELTTLNKVKEAIEKTCIINTVFDGEICLLDENGNEDFPGVMKELRRKDHQIENPVFMVFDMIHKPNFDMGGGGPDLENRLHSLRSWITTRHALNSGVLRYLDQFQIIDDNHFEHWSKMSAENNWEGFMLRKNIGYEGKRSKNLLKVKKFFDAEYKVVDYDNDNHEVVRDGKSETMKMLAQVWIEHKGHRVKVGSGWTQDQRLQYMDGSIVGKTITVQYFEETHNQEGGISLRFPTVKIVHGEKRDM